MVLFAEHKPDLERNPVLKWMRSHLRMTNEYSGEHFTVVKDGLRYFTPLFAVLVMVEISDVIFAVDSIPAIFAVTTKPFIVFTSNVFAILGLRSLYFVLAGAMDYFRYLKAGLAVVLVFVGAKMLLASHGPDDEPHKWFQVDISTPASLLVVGGIITTSILLSVAARRWTKNTAQRQPK
jgi:tellurite resistance protein TerC